MLYEIKLNKVFYDILSNHHLLAMDPGNVNAPIDGFPTKEPAFGLDALWINENEKERAQCVCPSGRKRQLRPC